jgi:hypothetical protein
MHGKDQIVAQNKYSFESNKKLWLLQAIEEKESEVSFKIFIMKKAKL